MPRHLATLMILLFAAAAGAAEPGLDLVLRDRVPSLSNAAIYQVRERAQHWDASKTAIIICDMWDLHHCKRAVDRVKEMAPRMNEVITKARDRGVFIIHAPSSCMAPYENTPMRQRAKNAPKAGNLPTDIGAWCRNIPAEEKGKYPIDQTDGGEDDEKEEHAAWAAKLAAMGRNPKAPWKSQYDVLKIDERDAISDSGVEIWNVLEQRGITNVVLMGVHTNMCVLGRPFGLRQMARNGKNVVLMRDMTDTMYNPDRWPFVSHFRGTDLIVEHVEKFVCPTVTSDQILGGTRFRFKNDARPLVVIAISEDGYKTAETLPAFVRDVVQDRLGVDTLIVTGDPKDPSVLPGLADALTKADLLLLSVRRRALPEADLAAIRKFVNAGKPMLGIRAASHAFDFKGKLAEGRNVWPGFDADILGSRYLGDNGAAAKPTVKIAEGADSHRILTGVRKPFTGHGTLYQFGSLAKSATPLLLGTAADRTEPVAWINRLGESRIFYTSLGHPDDFQDPSFRRLLSNAILWGLEKAIPAE